MPIDSSSAAALRELTASTSATSSAQAQKRQYDLRLILPLSEEIFDPANIQSIITAFTSAGNNSPFYGKFATEISTNFLPPKQLADGSTKPVFASTSTNDVINVLLPTASSSSADLSGITVSADVPAQFGISYLQVKLGLISEQGIPAVALQKAFLLACKSELVENIMFPNNYKIDQVSVTHIGQSAAENKKVQDLYSAVLYITGASHNEIGRIQSLFVPMVVKGKTEDAASDGLAKQFLLKIGENLADELQITDSAKYPQTFTADFADPVAQSIAKIELQNALPPPPHDAEKCGYDPNPSILPGKWFLYMYKHGQNKAANGWNDMRFGKNVNGLNSLCPHPTSGNAKMSEALFDASCFTELLAVGGTGAWAKIWRKDGACIPAKDAFGEGEKRTNGFYSIEFSTGYKGDAIVKNLYHGPLFNDINTGSMWMWRCNSKNADGSSCAQYDSGSVLGSQYDNSPGSWGTLLTSLPGRYAPGGEKGRGTDG
ncbi:unnamed protein product, partial [Amoebophrya sp. A120]|eukprot:GSA120T00010157001.1